MKVSKPDIEIILPEHEHTKKTVICYSCKGEMSPCTGSEIYHVDGKKILISNIKLYRCTKCKENVYSATEAKMIEDAVYGV